VNELRVARLSRRRRIEWWRRGSCGRFRPVLSEVEGNPLPGRPSFRDSSFSTGFPADALRRANRAARSTLVPRASAWQSSPHPWRSCVHRSGVADLRQRRHRRNRRRSGEYSSNTSEFLPFDSPRIRARSGQIFRPAKNLEAGGVEPPSEKPCHPKTTCLSRSEGFADEAQSGQDAPPASPMFSPPHYGPKCDGQPTV